MRPVALSLLFVITGLVGRAVLDKLLAATGGIISVAEWAQISNIADVVMNVSLSGIGIALTALSAGHLATNRLALLKPALQTSLALSSVVALAGFAWLPLLGTSLVPSEQQYLALALIAGLLNVAPGILVAHFLGTGQILRATMLVALGVLPPLALLFIAPMAAPTGNLLAGQIIFGGLILAGLTFTLRSAPSLTKDTFRTLLRFVPAGLAIGILSPAATAWARAQFASDLSWDAVGQMQSIWRTTDWVTAVMAGVLNAHFLPRLGRVIGDRPAFEKELWRSGVWTVIPAGIALGLLWLMLPAVLPMLYRDDVGVGRGDAVFFFLGDWLRIMSWVALFALFARRSAWTISIGEVLSLPLFALLLSILHPNQLRAVGALWLLTYAAYAAFNGIVLACQMRTGKAK